MKRLHWTLLACLGAAAAAHADTVDMACIANGNGRTIQATLGAQTWDTFAGRLIHQTSAGTGSLAGLPSNILTFCAEILQAQAASPSTYSLSSVATLSGNTGITNLGFAKQQAIYDLYSAAAGRQFTLGLDYACAFQIAVWEVIYDYNTAPRGTTALDINSGNFRVAGAGGTTLSASITLIVKDLLAHVGTNAPAGGVIGLRSAQFQDELYNDPGDSIVPLPTGTWMGACGLALAAFIRRRVRR